MDSMGTELSAEERGLLTAIIDSPEDDFVRLVYADWLQDQRRDVRAQFIRDQLTLAQLVAAEAYDTEEYVETLARVHAVPDRSYFWGFRHLGLEPAPPILIDILADWVMTRTRQDVRVGYHRGLATSLSIPHAALCTNLPEVLRRAPIREIALAGTVAITLPPPPPRGGYPADRPPGDRSKASSHAANPYRARLVIRELNERYDAEWPTREALVQGLQPWAEAIMRGERLAPDYPALNRTAFVRNELLTHWYRVPTPDSSL